MELEDFDPQFMLKIKEFMQTNPIPKEMHYFVSNNFNLIEQYGLNCYEVHSFDLLE